MSQETQIVPIEGRRLVLGFDGGCTACSGLAELIKEQVGDKLEILSLYDPQVEQWRKNALGSDAPWAPTLIEVKGLKIRAWTGWRLGTNLSRFLGPVSTWRIMQALGEMSAAPSIENSAIVDKLPGKAAEAVVGMSRGQFLKGVGGVAVAMSMLSATALAPRAEALEQWQYPNFVRSRVLQGAELRDHCNRTARRASCEWTAGAWAPAMQSGLSVTSSTDRIAQGGGVKAMAVVHRTASGNRMWATTFDLKGKKLLALYEWEHPRNNIKWEVKRWGFDSSLKTLWTERADINGAHFTDPTAPSLQAQATCPPTCDGFTGSRQIRTCGNLDLSCARERFSCISGIALVCSPASVATGAGAAACALALFACPDKIFNFCCRQTCTVCFPCTGLNT